MDQIPRNHVKIPRVGMLCSREVRTYFMDDSSLNLLHRYQGSMSRNERNRAVRAFMTKEDATVMLMSLKCGGVGLNLTRANREL
jgi:hypothetical protein